MDFGGNNLGMPIARRPWFQAKSITSQSVTTSTYTKVLFQTVDGDTGLFDLSLNRFVCPNEGWWIFYAWLEMPGGGGTPQMTMAILPNSFTNSSNQYSTSTWNFSGNASIWCQPAQAGDGYMQLTLPMMCKRGDYVEVAGYNQNSTPTFAAGAVFRGVFLGP